MRGKVRLPGGRWFAAGAPKVLKVLNCLEDDDQFVEVQAWIQPDPRKPIVKRAKGFVFGQHVGWATLPSVPSELRVTTP